MFNKYPLLTKLAGGIKDDLIKIHIGAFDKENNKIYTPLKQIRRELTSLARKVNSKVISEGERNSILARIAKIEESADENGNYNTLQTPSGPISSAELVTRFGRFYKPLGDSPTLANSVVFANDVEPHINPLAETLGFLSARHALKGDPRGSIYTGEKFLEKVVDIRDSRSSYNIKSYGMDDTPVIVASNKYTATPKTKNKREPRAAEVSRRALEGQVASAPAKESRRLLKSVEDTIVADSLANYRVLKTLGVNPVGDIYEYNSTDQVPEDKKNKVISGYDSAMNKIVAAVPSDIIYPSKNNTDPLGMLPRDSSLSVIRQTGVPSRIHGEYIPYINSSYSHIPDTKKRLKELKSKRDGVPESKPLNPLYGANGEWLGPDLPPEYLAELSKKITTNNPTTNTPPADTPPPDSKTPSFLQANKGRLAGGAALLALLGAGGMYAYKKHKDRKRSEEAAREAEARSVAARLAQEAADKQKQEQAAAAIMAAKNLSEAQRRRLLRNIGIGTGTALGSYGLYRALR